MGQFTVFTGTVSGTVGSLITALDAILLSVGWTKPAGLIGTNHAAYLSGGACPVYLDVNDNSPAYAYEAWACGYETMSGVGTGTGGFPQSGQGASGPIAAYVVRKSPTASSTTHNYIAFADAGTLYLFIATGDTAGAYLATAFGEFDSLKAGDSYRNLFIGRFQQANPGASYEGLDVINGGQGIAYVTGGGVVQRPYNGVAGSVYASRIPDAVPYYWGSRCYLGQGSMPYPNPVDSKIYISPMRLMECNSAANAYTSWRGSMRGLWSSSHPVASFNDGDTFSGTGTLGGKTFRFVKLSQQGGVYCIETSATLSDP